jgi:Ca2+-transporting ATPase
VPYLRDLFGFEFLHDIDLTLALAAGIISIAWFEALKLLYGNRHGGLASQADSERKSAV